MHYLNKLCSRYKKVHFSLFRESLSVISFYSNTSNTAEAALLFRAGKRKKGLTLIRARRPEFRLTSISKDEFVNNFVIKQHIKTLVTCL